MVRLLFYIGTVFEACLNFLFCINREGGQRKNIFWEGRITIGFRLQILPYFINVLSIVQVRVLQKEEPYHALCFWHCSLSDFTLTFLSRKSDEDIMERVQACNCFFVFFF